MCAKVLIVEDEFLIAMQLEDIVTEGGHDVVGTICDMASLGGLDEGPEVAFVDLNLRDGPTGASIARELAARFGTSILYVTANPAQIGEPASTAIGFILKPFSSAAILTAISLAAGNGHDIAAVPREINVFQRPAN